MPSYFDPIVIGDERFSLEHLEPFTFPVASELAQKDLRIHVTFSNHCFTKKYDASEHPAGEPILDQHTPRPPVILSNSLSALPCAA